MLSFGGRGNRDRDGEAGHGESGLSCRFWTQERRRSLTGTDLQAQASHASPRRRRDGDGGLWR